MCLGRVRATNLIYEKANSVLILQLVVHATLTYTCTIILHIWAGWTDYSCLGLALLGKWERYFEIRSCQTLKPPIKYFLKKYWSWKLSVICWWNWRNWQSEFGVLSKLMGWVNGNQKEFKNTATFERKICIRRFHKIFRQEILPSKKWMLVRTIKNL